MFKICSVLMIVSLLFCGAAFGEVSTIKLMGGSLNGTEVDPDRNMLEIEVDLDGSITGTVTIQTNNVWPGENIVPLVMVWGWGAHETSFTTIDDWIPTGVATYDVSIDLTAPSDYGVFYIIFADAMEMNGTQVASLTNWQVPDNPHWNDSCDVADWGPMQYRQSMYEHMTFTPYEGAGGWHYTTLPAAMIKVQVGDLSTLELASGNLNGMEVEDGDLRLMVAPGESITGEITVRADNTGAPGDVAPLVMVWSWGPHETGYTTINSWIPTGISTYTVPINLTAPDDAGSCFISFAFCWELNGAQVASLTNWQVPGNPHWNDGHDIADWAMAEYRQAVVENMVKTVYEGPGGWHDRLMPASIIELAVGSYSTTRLLSGSLNGVEVVDGVLELLIDPDVVETISGNLTIEANNVWAPNNIAPLVMVGSWFDHESGFSVIDDWVPTGVNTYNVPVDFEAPEERGLYFISFVFAMELEGYQVASLTNWQVPGNPHWNDGHDAADWTLSDYSQSVVEHVVNTSYEGAGGWHDAILPAAMVMVDARGLAVDENGLAIPMSYSLYQAYPNPFNAHTTIEYALPRTSAITIDIYDLLGRKVETLIDGEQQAGYHRIGWNAGTAASGIYFYRLAAKEYVETRRMLLLK